MSETRLTERNVHLTAKLERLQKQNKDLKTQAVRITAAETDPSYEKVGLEDHMKADTESMLNAYADFQTNLLSVLTSGSLKGQVLDPAVNAYESLEAELHHTLERLHADMDGLQLKMEDVRDGTKAKAVPDVPCTQPQNMIPGGLYCFYGGHKPENVKRAMAGLTRIVPNVTLYVCPKHNEEAQEYLSRIRSKTVLFQKRTGVYEYSLYNTTEQ